MANVTIKNPTDFANALLGALGAPDTKTNVSNIVAWENQEGGNWNNTAKFNPLNTTQQEQGSTVMGGGNSAGVQAYTSWQQGIDATVSTLQQNQTGYSQILHDLSVSAPWKQFAANVDSSAWGTKGLNPGTAPAPSASGNVDAGNFGAGQTITTQSGLAGNSPSTSTKSIKLQGLAGILQALQDLYSPPTPGIVASLTSLGSANIQQVATLIFVRAASTILFVGIMAMGVKTLTSGSTSGSGSAGPNVLEFVNNSQISNTRTSQSDRRLTLAEAHENRISNKPASPHKPVKPRVQREPQPY